MTKTIFVLDPKTNDLVKEEYFLTRLHCPNCSVATVWGRIADMEDESAILVCSSCEQPCTITVGYELDEYGKRIVKGLNR